jgi:carbon monoxide dehydrogenase subunit G
MPGAELVETVDENNWKANMAVKLGPISLNFATEVARESADETAGVVTLSAKARETRGRGGAQAAIQSTLSEAGESTRVDIVTDLTMSGAVAQYGRGIVADVAGQLTAKFADCLKAQLVTSPSSSGSSTEAAERESAAAPEVKPISGLSLGVGAIGRMIAGFFSRLLGRGPESR